VLAIVCPGQGSQLPGFLQPWLELPEVADHLTWLSAVTGIDLIAHGTTSDAETIRDTAVAQPLIVASGLVGHRVLTSRLGTAPDAEVTAGHSVGELTSAVLAGVLTVEQALVFVRERGRLMAGAAAGAAAGTGMSAVLGGDPEQVAEALDRHGLVAANQNGAGQVVAAGTVENLQALAADPPARARVTALKVTGAFHTEHMAPAVESLTGLARAITTADPRITWFANADGKAMSFGPQALSALVAQVSNPVRWDLCMESMLRAGVTGLLELPPAKTLTNLAKRAMSGVETVALKSPDDLDAAIALVEAHTSGGTR
jgi:[acyl-carrier-protein] S-malonyltransferase